MCRMEIVLQVVDFSAHGKVWNLTAREIHPHPDPPLEELRITHIF